MPKHFLLLVSPGAEHDRHVRWLHAPVVLSGHRRAVLGPVVHPDLVRRRTVQRELEAQPPVSELLRAIGVRHRHPVRIGIPVEDRHAGGTLAALGIQGSGFPHPPPVDRDLVLLHLPVFNLRRRELLRASRLTGRDGDIVGPHRRRIERNHRRIERNAHILAQRP